MIYSQRLETNPLKNQEIWLTAADPEFLEEIWLTVADTGFLIQAALNLLPTFQAISVHNLGVCINGHKSSIQIESANLSIFSTSI